MLVLYFIYFIAGAILLTLFSIPLRLVLGINLSNWTGNIAPVIIGGVCGLSIGYFYLGYKKAMESKFELIEENEKKLKEINKALETKIEERTSELKKLNTHLQELLQTEKFAKEKFKKITDSFIDLYFETDTLGNITFITPSCYNLLDYTPEELIGKNAIELYKNPEERAELLEKLKKGEIISDYKITMLAKNGEGIQTSLNAKNIIDGNGNIIGVLGTLRDDRERQKAEQELKKMHIIVEQNPASIVITDTEGTIEYVNPKFEEITGYTLDEAIGQNPRILKTDYHSDEYYEELWETITSGKVWRGEFYNKKKNGEFYWESAIISPIIDENGEIIQFLAIKEDITLIKESQAKYKAITTAAQDAIIMIDNLGKAFMWNPAAEKIFDYTADEIIGKDIHRIIAPNKFYQHFKENFAKFNTTGKGNAIGKTIELIGLKKDGTEIPIEISLSAVKLKNEWNAVAFIRDITKRKQAEEQIIKERDKARLYLDISGVFFVEINSKGEVVLINKKGCEILGYSEEEILGKNWFDNFLPERITNLVKSISQKILAGEIEGQEYMENYIVTKEGEERLIAWHNTILRNSSGEITGHLSSGIDITDRKIMEDEMKLHLENMAVENKMIEEQAFKINEVNEKLYESQEELKGLNATKDKFFSIIAHDLKNPIGASKQLMDIIVEDYNDLEEEERLEIINEIAKATNNTYELLLQLLDWSRSQRGTIDFNPQKLDLNFILNRNIELLKTAAENKDISLINEIPENTIVYADPNMLTTIFRNLISNAIKFTPNNGKITIYLKDSSKNNYIELIVEDTGVGISEENQNKLFRIDSTHSTLGTNQEKGTGLGLILVKEFVEKHGGKIWVESQEDKGSKFIFTIPKQLIQNKNNT